MSLKKVCSGLLNSKAFNLVSTLAMHWLAITIAWHKINALNKYQLIEQRLYGCLFHWWPPMNHAFKYSHYVLVT